MSEILQVTKVDALKAFANTDDKGKSLLVDLYGASTFYTKITDLVKTFEDVLTLKGINTTGFDAYCADLTSDEKAYRKIKLIAEVLNEGSTNNIYFPVFNKIGDSGLSYNSCNYDRRNSGVGSRLCFKNAELAKYAGTQFLAIYTSFLTIKN